MFVADSDHSRYQVEYRLIYDADCCGHISPEVNELARSSTFAETFSTADCCVRAAHYCGWIWLQRLRIAQSWHSHRINQRGRRYEEELLRGVPCSHLGPRSSLGCDCN